MSKKDYITFAKMIAERLEICNDKSYPANERLIAKMTIRSMTLEIADIFEQDNPQFNRDKFLQAAGYTE